MNEKIDNLAQDVVYALDDVSTNGVLSTSYALVELMRAVIRDELGKADPADEGAHCLTCQAYSGHYGSCEVLVQLSIIESANKRLAELRGSAK